MRRVGPTIGVVVLWLVVFGGVASAGGGDVEVSALIGGESTASADNASPLDLGDSLVVPVELTVTNGTGADLAVERIRLEGTAFGVTFLAYDTQLPFSVPAGETETVAYDLPLNDVRDQATGLLPASIAVYDASGERIAGQSFTLDVKGRTGSVVGVFALMMLVIALIALGVNLFLVARRRLPPNRIVRGLRFLVPGVGFGLFAAVGLAMVRLMAPYPAVWPWFVVVPGAAAFVVGYLSPGPLDPDDDYDEFDELAEDLQPA